MILAVMWLLFFVVANFRLSMVEGGEEDEGPKKLDHPAHTSEKRVNSVTIIKLDVKDPLLTKIGKAQNKSVMVPYYWCP